ncbi:hypothetical protein GEMRC1_012478 [Eukaryota sp. GEM-RC1]
MSGPSKRRHSFDGLHSRTPSMCGGSLSPKVISSTRLHPVAPSAPMLSLRPQLMYIRFPQSLINIILLHLLRRLSRSPLEVDFDRHCPFRRVIQVIPTFLKKVGYVSHRFFESSSLAVKVMFHTNTFHVVSEDLPQLYSFASFFKADVRSIFLYSNLTSKVEDFLGHSSIITGLKLNLDETIDLEFLNKTSLYFPRLKQLLVQASSSISMLLIELLKENSTVTSIDLSWNYIGDEGARALANVMKVNTTVTSINLSRNSISAKGIKVLAEALKVNSAVTSINLGNNSIGDEGAVSLAEMLKVNSTLVRIDLRINAIRDEGASALAEALKINNTVTSIYIYGNSIGDVGARALAQALKINNVVEIEGVRL